jgi:CO/xanthine dehydrogenase Mo-binding subunit
MFRDAGPADAPKPVIGAATSRVDSRAKVTGTARYGSDFDGGQSPAYAFLATSAIARGRITAIDETAARAVRGVLESFTDRNVGDRVKPGKMFAAKGYMGATIAPLASDRVPAPGRTTGSRPGIRAKTSTASGTASPSNSASSRPSAERVVSPYIGGAIGSRGSLTRRTALVAPAARQLRRPVRLEATRRQGSTVATYRAETRHRIRLGAGRDAWSGGTGERVVPVGHRPCLRLGSPGERFGATP